MIGMQNAAPSFWTAPPGLSKDPETTQENKAFLQRETPRAGLSPPQRRKELKIRLF